MFSKKVLSINESPIRKFAGLCRQAEENGKRVIPLNIGQPDIKTPTGFFDAIRAVDPSTVVAYTASTGIDPLLDGFEKYYRTHGMDFLRDDILITNGGSEALSFTFSCLCDPDDEVLICEPYYSNYTTLAKYAGAVLVPVTAEPEDNYRMPPYEKIAAKITPKTKAILVTNPNNPTGLVCTRDEIERIVKIACEYNLFIISDEVYREYIYDGNEYVSFTEYPQTKERLIIIDSVSKRFSSCGVRIGCIACKNKEFIAQCLKLCQSRLCAPLIEQIGAAALFDTDEDYIKESVEAYRRRRDVCFEALKNTGWANIKRPEGAFYFIIALPVEDADKFTAWLLADFAVDNETIMLCPAHDCYATPGKGRNEVRISYCINEIDLAKGMNILIKGVDAYRKAQSEKAASSF